MLDLASCLMLYQVFVAQITCVCLYALCIHVFLVAHVLKLTL